jgi:dCTP diphosphatase
MSESRQLNPYDSIKALTDLVTKFRDARDWAQFHNPKDMAISLSLEASELLEHFQWRSPQEVEIYLQQHKAEVAEELADVLYWVLLMSKDLNIAIGQAFTAKMAKNELKYPVDKAKGNYKKHTEHTEQA